MVAGIVTATGHDKSETGHDQRLRNAARHGIDFRFRLGGAQAEPWGAVAGSVAGNRSHSSHIKRFGQGTPSAWIGAMWYGLARLLTERISLSAMRNTRACHGGSWNSRRSLHLAPLVFNSDHRRMHDVKPENDDEDHGGRDMLDAHSI